MTYTDKDLQQIKDKNISINDIEKQLNYFRKGFPYLDLISPALLDSGISTIKDKDHYTKLWDNYLLSNKKVIKFVPASGAATRMFKDLFEYRDNTTDSIEKNKNIKIFIENIHLFSFFDDLNKACIEKYSSTIDKLISENKEREVISLLLNKDGLDYGNKPKGLLKFHSYENQERRTPLEEHLIEGFLYANNRGTVNIHFTVSPEHKELFLNLKNVIAPQYSEKLEVQFNITFSEQKSSTDTIAVDLENKPFRDNDQLLFRPAGHGALLENLNDLDADILFIKNIDNVVLDKYKTDDVLYKKVLAGYLINIQSQILKYLEILDDDTVTESILAEMISFNENILNIKNVEISNSSSADKIQYLKNKFNRPIRVCGMVKNIGEPGGGPFFVKDKTKTESLQILESSQIDKNDITSLDIFNNSTHFNPVDIVCGIKNNKGVKFDLSKYTDPDSGFISNKSKNGHELKALELPGLWNGSMSNWNTVFIEVPLETFNPVKTVLDLLRKEHQQNVTSF